MQKELPILLFDSSTHNPPHEIWNGDRTPHQEIPSRVETISLTLLEKGYELQQLKGLVPESLLERVHSRRYIKYLKKTQTSINSDQYRYPSVFGLKQSDVEPGDDIATQGFYSFDMYTPLSNETYMHALQSASLGWALAQKITKGDIRAGYALCRPPGHHAEKEQMGGYCYFNNAAVTAEYLSEYGKVAVLDVDFHHGNGTQHIFYDRDDVLTVSIHAKPQWKFPYMSGFIDETGVGLGEKCNVNYPLEPGVTNSEYQSVLSLAIDNIKSFAPDSLVVSFGADTHESDPIGGFKLTTEYYTVMAKTLKGLGLPTVIVQEGGYNTSQLGENVASFLSGFEK